MARDKSGKFTDACRYSQWIVCPQKFPCNGCGWNPTERAARMRRIASCDFTTDAHGRKYLALPPRETAEVASDD